MSPATLVIIPFTLYSSSMIAFYLKINVEQVVSLLYVDNITGKIWLFFLQF